MVTSLGEKFAAMAANMSTLPASQHVKYYAARVAAKLEAGGFKRAESLKDFDRICQAAEAATMGRLCKGLLFVGKVGSGKSLAASCLMRRYRINCEDAQSVSFCDVRRDDRTDFDCGGWLLDDFGREAVVNEFGTKHEFLAEFLIRQYRQRENWTSPPLITTNLDSAKLVERYDAHLVSRLAEMFVMVEFQEDDHRISKFEKF